MSFDGIFTHLMVRELNEKLIGGRINKIHQPYENEVVLLIRSQGKNHKLLLSAHPSYARIQLTSMEYRNPQTPPNFAMMLRKHLESAILEEIEQVENDRIIHFSFSKRNELGDLENIVLIVELMGRHSTILLLNKDSGKILDVIKHVGASQNSYRLLLPGATYVMPPKNSGINPFIATDPQVFERLSSEPETTAASLQSKFQGFGRDTANEIAFLLQRQPNKKMHVWHDFINRLLEDPHPSLIKQNQKEFFTPIPFASLLNDDCTIEHYSSLSELLDAFYYDKAERDRVKQQGGQLLKLIHNELERNKKKLKKREQTLLASENSEEYRQKGELLTTFMHQVPKGETSVTLENYYVENQPIEIALNPALSANQNAQKYFQKYQKLRNAVKVVGSQIQETKEEITYLESVQSQLEIARPRDVAMIQEELRNQGYLKKRNTKEKVKSEKSKPEQFFATDGTEILVGKNNLQNDELSLRVAKKNEFWLHAKDIPGSHVIIRSSEPTKETIVEAAQLAAYHSKYRNSSRVPVDLVQVRYLKKPNGAKPGYVIYENQTTYFVTPEEELVNRLRKK